METGRQSWLLIGLRKSRPPPLSLNRYQAKTGSQTVTCTSASCGLWTKTGRVVQVHKRSRHLTHVCKLPSVWSYVVKTYFKVTMRCPKHATARPVTGESVSITKATSLQSDVDNRLHNLLHRAALCFLSPDLYLMFLSPQLAPYLLLWNCFSGETKSRQRWILSTIKMCLFVK